MSLDDLVQDTTDPNSLLDEVEIQKGFLQLARSLEFLHDSNLVHTNLNGKSVLVNGKGDWKLSGFGFMTNLNEAESQQFQEDLEDELPDTMKRNLDYIDPLYALEGQVKPTNDMFSLGILLFMALHHGTTPYQTYGSMNALRAYSEQISSKIRSARWNMLDSDVQGM